MDQQAVYLLHFTEPFKHARHYIGWSSKPLERFEDHLRGHGSRLVQHVVKAGIGVLVARVWKGKDRYFERRLKNQNHGPRLCPICNPGVPS